MSPPSREINGPRPAPLKISKDSHLIAKPSSAAVTAGNHHRHQPVIIYTHSPKVIHTQAQNFMALVQKLTGLSHSKADETPSPLPIEPPPPPIAAAEESSSPEMLAMGFDPQFLPEFPLFTPNTSSDFFCSPGGFYGSAGFSPANQAAGSPLFIEAMRGFPDF